MKLTRQLLSVAFALLWSAALASAVPGRAEVKKIVGTATLINVTGASSSLAAGMALGSGDTISTGPSSTVDLDLGLNGDVLRVEPDSTVKLDQLDISNVRSPIVNTKLNVTKGGVTANVITKLAAASRYEVRTPNGVAGIRGTIYNASVGTGMSVLHGAVSWTPTGGVVVNLSMGQSANQSSVPQAIALGLANQAVASVTQATGATQVGQLANTVNTLAQSVATSAAIAVLAGGGTQAQAAAAASSAAQQVTAQVTTALTSVGLGSFSPTAQTAVAAAAVGAATAVASSGGTAAQAQAAAATAAGSAAAATGGTVTAAITTVANTAATATAAAVAGGATGAAAASASVTSSAVSTTQTVTTSTGTGGGAPVAATTTAIENPLTVSASGAN